MTWWLRNLYETAEMYEAAVDCGRILEEVDVVDNEFIKAIHGRKMARLV